MSPQYYYQNGENDPGRWTEWPTNGTTSEVQVVGSTYTSATSATNGTWQVWVDPSYRPTYASSTATVWRNWHIETNPDTLPRPPSADELASLAQARLEQERTRQEAAQRAEELLVSCLTEDQRHELAALDQFQVVAASGRVYVIHRGYAGNVESPAEHLRFCIHGPHSLPAADHMLSQMLMLQTEEAEFRRIANISTMRVAA